MSVVTLIDIFGGVCPEDPLTADALDVTPETA